MSSEESSEDVHDPTLQAHAYTSVFQIERRIRKINDFNVPLRGGLVPMQAATFAGALLVFLILWFLLVSPLFMAIFNQAPGVLAVMFIFGPTILITRAVGRPMSNGKKLPGWIRSRARAYLDDEWHRAGTPVRRRPAAQDKILHITRVWTPDAEGAEYISSLTGDDGQFAPPTKGYYISPADEALTREIATGSRSIDLLEWVEATAAADAEVARIAFEKSRADDFEKTIDHATFGTVQSD